MKALSAAVLAAVFAAGSAQAASVSASTSNANPKSTTALTGFSTFGNQMTGMSVTAQFANSTVETLSWAVTGAGAGGVSGVNFSLTESGDTFGSSWVLTNLSASRLVSFSINAGVGNTVFDLDTGGEGTTGSASGWTFTDNSPGVTGSVTATYSSPVSLTGFPAVGDLYAFLAVNLSGLTGGGLTGTYQFIADTDNLRLAGDLNPVVTPVPAALPLFASGLAGLGWLARRKRKQAA